MGVNRREFLQGAGASMALAGSAAGMASATAASGGDQLMIGDMSLQTLSDGNLVLPQGFLFPEQSPEQLMPILTRHGVAQDPMEPPLNVTLMRQGDRVVLFDAGSGPAFQASAGQLPAALEAAGVSPEDVTHVVFTHCHPDHLWGVLDDFDDPLFANAEHFIGQQEWDFWFDPSTIDTIGEARATMAAGALRRMEILEDQITRFRDGEEILPGVAARATYGHTPGHMSFELRSGSESVMVLGDAIGNSHVSFERPDWHVGSDQDAAMAAAARMSLLDQLAHEQTRVIGYHLPEGGLGQVARKGDGYRFIPL
ncbi:MAG: MBL fold metallo-hydrolase [Pseudophaeobacter sp. bin_em_oilr2.035]|uniref:MBL fold metallo-hydrolase n=2 Tax=Phaeobacter gallaeciensis TaxID=60890 RepID=A0ABD4XAF2_9RHOB|nr:MBL fold metallo-hydrolase [Phaeobacter gallaeciensis]MDF1771526.1 MBL fold metallo-hydrolase [Pseudophaeobacter sp. bin_em_oilr2.035]MDE4145407.1 MBL fold metallo-hydrolase [Phaeobacter gallaeciensis]MDE4158078.1 MBL fold metallo-hydrolase [Phaeobacter gallaeciensis]MDE4162257.1 MBL fold metallo-hydrolase [Phaeobacter gallaeciensis]MDE4166483.1 MBL fold metallo-hydrolase [Phaeobacter gallaeciensis]